MKKIILVLLTLVFGVIILVIILLILFSKDNCRYELGDGYAMDVCENTMDLLDSNNAIIVSSVILEYAYDSTFIIVSQRPWEVPGVSYRWGMTLRERDSIFEHSTFRQYFIINKKERHEFLGFDSLIDCGRYSNVYGPFNKEEYLQKREELGVPKELQLKE
ncbi:MAG: hypothetical protein KatS3mg028_0613 [Bacteroidia bacterium]|nr:MAG: hypothetical protein KatS3mg028_0613 [Bacteroidia bacterium]